MSLEPILTASLPIKIHAAAAIGAFAIGLVQMIGIKGTSRHRALGWSWVFLMAIVAISAFWIHQIRLWGQWSPIHVLSIAVLIQLPLAVMAARQHNIRAHKRYMSGLFLGALILAGLFTLAPGRIFYQVLFG